MIIRLTIGVILGVGFGAITGYFGKCKDGVCPLTANPWRGMLVGGILGALIAVA